MYSLQLRLNDSLQQKYIQIFCKRFCNVFYFDCFPGHRKWKHKKQMTEKRWLSSLMSLSLGSRPKNKNVWKTGKIEIAVVSFKECNPFVSNTVFDFKLFWLYFPKSHLWPRKISCATHVVSIDVHFFKIIESYTLNASQEVWSLFVDCLFTSRNPWYTMLGGATKGPCLPFF